jgi:diguanylate cyclase (GGDEF)-like protein
MKPITGPFAYLDSSRDELAKAWLIRLIERASLEEIGELPTDRIARQLPELISDIVASVADGDGNASKLTEEQAGRAAALAALRSGRESSAGDLAQDVAALQAVLVRALREELADRDPGRFAEAVERLAEATGAIQAAAAEELIRRRSRELASQASADPLTGLGNPRHLQKRLAHLVAVHKRYGHPFAVLLMDVDGLKRINDAHGRPAGNRVLTQMAMALRRSIRSVDVAARFGGDEFCVLALQQTPEAARTLAERLAAAVGAEVMSPGEPPVSVSIGVAACPSDGNDAETLIDAADRAMYRAKATGARVAVSAPPSPEVAEEATT